MIYRLLTLLFFCIIFFGTNAQDHIQFKNYTINNGLSQSTVSCVIQDKLGTLWIGTQDGINRFNGKNFEVFSSDRGYDISNDYIITNYIDSDYNIWFGTYNGLTKYDSEKVKFSSYSLEKENKRIEIHSISQDNNGNIWLGTSFGKIFKFNIKKEKFELVDDKTFESPIIDIKIVNNRMIFVSEFEGILLTDNQFSHKKRVYLKKGWEDNFRINKLINSYDKKLIITTNKGVFLLNEEKNTLESYGKLFNQFKDFNIIDIIYLNENKLVIATENSGIFLANKITQDSLNVVHYESDPFQKGALTSNMINGLFKDDKDIVWILSDRGISSYNSNHIGFRGVGLTQDLKKGIPSQNVWGFEESIDGNSIFIAGDHGVSCYNSLEHRFYHFYRENDNNKDYTTLCVKALTEDKLLVGSYDGLFELTINIDTPSVYNYEKINLSKESQRGFEVIYTIIPFKNKNQYLIGTKGGVILFDYETKEIKYLYNDNQKENTLGAGACRLIFSYKNEYYAAPSTGGIYKIDDVNGELIAYSKHSFSLLNSVSNSYFSDILKAENGIFWLGTQGDGLFKFDINSKEVRKFDKSNGLPNNVIYGVESVPSYSKYIWLSTNKGIVALNSVTNNFYTFSERDGLMSNELNTGASFVSSSGKIYFGGIQGYNYIRPNEAFYTNNKIRVFFSNIEVDNIPIFPEEDGILTRSISYTKKIKLPYDKRSLKLNFFANDLSNPSRIEYKYILVGSDSIEEYLGNSNEIRFSSLSPGYYELEIYARLTNGEWVNNPAKLAIEIERPWWLTWWFYLIIAIVISLFFYYRVRKNIDEERRRQVRLEMKISDRTRELRRKNEQIEQQRQELLLKKEELESEKDKSEKLLNNILPKETVSQLKRDGHSTAREFSKVSILFTDFVGFSKIAEKMPAKDLVGILDMHFRKFDEIIDKNDLEKIKTIGDAYMAAGGVPIRNKTNPINTTLAAVQIKYYMLQHKLEQMSKGEPYWKLRIGINTGPVSAGVIGTKRYAYDVWGNTVNRAQRMEKFCEPEKIAVTEDTFNYIEPYFECKRIGKVEMKSGIRIVMYEVISIKPELSLDGLGIEPNEAFEKLVVLHHFSKINYYKAEKYILSKLKKELNSKLHYHSYIHSKDVTRQAERIAIEEGITDEDLFLLKSAASYHDAGFVERYEHNESIGARMAEEILPRFGYTEEHIQRIKELIFVTSVPHKPKNKLEEIICDADLDYLGREDFHEIADRLRRELREHGKINSDRKWDEMQVIFFYKHRYFTNTSIRNRLPLKMKNLEDIKKRLAEDNYKD